MDRSRRRRQADPRAARSRWSVFVGALFVGACQQPSGVTVTAASAEATTSDAAQTTAASPEATTSGAAQSAAAEPTTAAVSTEAEPSTTGGGGASGSASAGTEGECPDLEDPTTGEINSKVVEECDVLCAHYKECGLKEHELCRMGCVAKFGVDHQECYEAGSAARGCLTMMTCEELGAYLQFNEGGPCAQLLEAQHEACTCQSQTIFGTNVCAYNLDCPYLPFRRIVCGNGACECYVGEDLVKTCSPRNTCHDGFDIYDEAESCCCMFH